MKVVEIHKFSGSSTSVQAFEHWIKTGVYSKPYITTCDLGKELKVETSDGVLIANLCDYVVKTSDGKFYTLPFNIFKEF